MHNKNRMHGTYIHIYTIVCRLINMSLFILSGHTFSTSLLTIVYRTKVDQ